MYRTVSRRRRNNLLLYITFLRVAMFAPWRSQKSLRKPKDPITGNSFDIGEPNSSVTAK